jgi:hypothetical protein
MLNRVLLTALLSLSACSQLPDAPEIWQCGYSVKFNKFRCVNTRTKEAINLSRNDPHMEAAQCLSVDDYRSSQAWVESIIEISKQRCK